MLIPLLHRRRKEALAAVAHAARDTRDAVEQARRGHGELVFFAGLLWASVFLLARGLLEATWLPPWGRVLAALLPAPFFARFLWRWMRRVAVMDELERRIELEALAVAFPLALVLLSTIDLLVVAVPSARLDDVPWIWLPLLYYVGLWWAKRRYQ
jgi:hypothetical protein